MAPELQAPELVLPRPKPDGLEGDGHLDGPSTVEPPGTHLPDWIPVHIRRTLVGNFYIGKPSNGVNHEPDAISTVVEGVEDGAEVFVIE